jgi:hypothetical protein
MSTSVPRREEETPIRATRRPCVGRPRAAALSLALLLGAPAALAEDRASDAFLAGYVASLVERDLHWDRDSYRLTVVNGVATITLFGDDPSRRLAAEQALSTVRELRGAAVEVRAAETVPSGAGGGAPGAAGKGEAFPTGDVFRPLVADPKQAQFFVGLNRFTSSGARYTMASVGFGETFGLYRFSGGPEGQGLQVSVQGAIFAQFNLDTPSYDLVNADYVIGFPVTFRRGNGSLRFRVYHQSSHLGDELLLGANPPDRVNLSFEATEIIYAHEWRRWRLYAGGEYLLHNEPADLEPLSAHWGLEFCGTKTLVWRGRPIAGVDMKSLEEHDWAVDTSVKAGLEFGPPDPGQRRLRLMAEWYRGFDPRGQFYVNEVEYYGLALSLGF